MFFKPKLIESLGFVLILFGSFLSGCDGGDWEKEDNPMDYASYGDITLSIDENLKVLLDAEIDAFNIQHKFATITADYKPQPDCFEDLIEKKSTWIVASRKMNEEELEIFEKKGISPQQEKVATSAVALFVAQGNGLRRISRFHLKRILQGEYVNWEDIPVDSINGVLPEGEIVLVFDHPRSGVKTYFRDSILNGEEIKAKMVDGSSGPEAIELVGEIPGAIGFTDVLWFSDKDREETQTFYRGVSLLEVDALEGSPAEGWYHLPSQKYIGTRYYPYLREVWFIRGEPRKGLGTGFVNWVVGVKGQRIVLKTGLVPEYNTARIVEFPPKEGAVDIETYVKNHKLKK